MLKEKLHGADEETKGMVVYYEDLLMQTDKEWACRDLPGLKAEIGMSVKKVNKYLDVIKAFA